MLKYDPLYRESDYVFPRGYDPENMAEPDRWYFDEETADLYCEFIETYITLQEDEYAGKPMILADWQRFFIRAVFGWREIGTEYRRFKEAFIFVPRKNGKTSFTVAIVISVMALDDEGKISAYSVASDRNQAAIIFEKIRDTVADSEELSDLFTIYGGQGGNVRQMINKHNLRDVYKPLAFDAGRQQGLNPYLAIMDESHCWSNKDNKDRKQYSAIKKGSSARKQPLIINITTADYNRPSLCNDLFDYSYDICQGNTEDDRFFPMLYFLLPTEDWKDPENWKKANPMLGYSKSMDYFEEEFKRASTIVTEENEFKRYELNIRTDADVKYFSMDDWDNCGKELIDEDDLINEDCYAAIDLSSVDDLTALTLYFPKYKYIMPFAWIPEKNPMCRERYAHWIKKGVMTKTPGRTQDYTYMRRLLTGAYVVGDKVERDPDALIHKYNIKQVAFDPWNSNHFASQLAEEDDIEMVKFGQTHNYMNEPTKLIAKMVIDGELRHNNNPMLRWCANNCSATTNAGGSVMLCKPDKDSRQKIDPIIAAVMAIGLAHVDWEEGSAYEERGLRFL